MHIVFFIAIFGIGCFSGWQLRRPQPDAGMENRQRLAATAIRLLRWLRAVRSQHLHRMWEIEQGLDIELVLRNPWQFQDIFRLADVPDTALQDIWTFEHAPFCEVTKLLIAVSDYNALVDSAPQRLLRENSNNRYSADILSRLHALSDLMQTAATALEKIVGVPAEAEPKQAVLKSAA
jgi:hypothetical protein